MFESLRMAPPDPIMGVGEAFRRDPNPAKINLSTGVFADARGRTAVLASVKEAEAHILRAETTKSYRPIEGAAEFCEAARTLLLGSQSVLVASSRALTAHTPGGSGGLRVVGDFLGRHRPGCTLWLSEPTWPNHDNIFAAAGLRIRRYPYFDVAANALAYDAMLRAVRRLPPGDALLLHGCCHNPSGVDPDPVQWRALTDVIAQRNLFPVIDLAYQGFGVGLEEDVEGVRYLLQHCPEAMVCSSFSKNFGVYSERVGALTMVAMNAHMAQVAMSHLKVVIRSLYSNPPSHGGAIVSTILRDDALRGRWERELSGMRQHLQAMRQLLAETLTAAGVPGDHTFITRQRGMFSFLALGEEQVRRLRDEHSVYLVGNGRINVSGVTPGNVTRLCEAIAAVCAERPRLREVTP